MSEVNFKFPIPYTKAEAGVAINDKGVHLGYSGTNQYYFIIHDWVFKLLSAAAVLIFIVQASQPGLLHGKPDYYPTAEYQLAKEGDPLGASMQTLENVKLASLDKTADIRDRFMIERQLLVSSFLINEKVSRVDMLSNEKLLAINRQISDLFIAEVLLKSRVEPHVLKYFTDTQDLKKFETALTEQARFHVPASIKLAQSALETAYGQRVVNNNYFGIKDKTGQIAPIHTVEYYTAEEVRINSSKILRKEKIVKNGRELYRCVVKDHFQRYNTPWESFRAHSEFLSNSPRYSPLFTKGKSYEDWADKIGSTKYGGVGYATSPIYGELLKKIIRRYHLDLLDF